MAGKRELVVTGQKPITKMKLRNGGEATIYEVFAKTEGGEYVEEALRAFDELDVGQLIEYEVEPYNHPQHGMSYTLQPPKKEFHRRVREMEEQMAAVLRWAEHQGFNMQRWSKPQSPPPTPDERVRAEVKKKEEAREQVEKFGDDPPWESAERDLEKELGDSLNPQEGNDAEAAGGDPDVHDGAEAPDDADGRDIEREGDDR